MQPWAIQASRVHQPCLGWPGLECLRPQVSGLQARAPPAATYVSAGDWHCPPLANCATRNWEDTCPHLDHWACPLLKQMDPGGLWPALRCVPTGLLSGCRLSQWHLIFSSIPTLSQESEAWPFPEPMGAAADVSARPSRSGWLSETHRKGAAAESSQPFPQPLRGSPGSPWGESNPLAGCSHWEALGSALTREQYPRSPPPPASSA